MIDFLSVGIGEAPTTDDQQSIRNKFAKRTSNRFVTSFCDARGP